MHALLKTFVCEVDLYKSENLGWLYCRFPELVNSVHIGFNGIVFIYFELLPLIKSADIFSSEERFLLFAVNLGFCLFDRESFSISLNIRFKIGSYLGILLDNFKLLDLFRLVKIYKSSRNGLDFWLFFHNG
jgi:hypothetical protein